MPDWRYDERACPECGCSPTKWRRCTNAVCENGQIDRSRTDPILYLTKGPHWEQCDQCHGEGRMHWCPECGADLTTRDLEPMRFDPCA